MKQLKMFDSEPDINPSHLARRGDPETSHEAAEAVAADINRMQQAALEAVKKWPDRTAAELNRLAGWSVHKRLRELQRANRIYVTGARPCSLSPQGRKAITWRACP